MLQYDDIQEYRIPGTASGLYDIAKVTWADSDIRVWLNGDFLNEAFTEEERNEILLSEIATPDNSTYGTSGGLDTEDWVFFLSIDETEQYFKDNSDRIAECNMLEEDVDYILKVYEDWGWNYKGEDLGQRLNQKQPWWWWLRSPGYFSHNAASVYDDGLVGDHGYIVSNGGGVRPALWLNLESENL